MRKKIVAANWKMNLSLAEGKTLVEEIKAQLPALNENKLVVISSPFVHITQTAAQLNGVAHVYTGAQNCHQEASGAYTGEVSASMLNSAGVNYVILGHSERREYFGENSALLVKKMNQVMANGMKVIFCCGEPLEIRKAGTQNAYVQTQIEEALFGYTAEQMADITVAYEPIWAIGTGLTATSEEAQDMHAHIRSVLAGKFGAAVADNVSILYGGSCKPSNAAELFACKDVDGGLIGGAALKSTEFLGIIKAMSEA